MAICGHCQPTYRLLQENITRLKQDIKSKDDLILSFSTVATSQAKRLAQFSSSSYYSQSVGCSAAVHGDATLPWSGSATAGGESLISTEAHAPTDDLWPALGAKPKTRACSTPYDLEPWIQVRSSKGRARRSLHLRSSNTLPLNNSFQVLDDRDGNNSPDDPTRDIAKPATPAKGSAYATAAAVVQPPPVFGATDVLTADPRADPPSRRLTSSGPPLSRRSTQQTLAENPSSVLVVGSSMVQHVAVRGGRTYRQCQREGASLKEISSTAAQVICNHDSATTVIVQAGTNDLKLQQSESLKKDFVQLVNNLLDTGKQVVISGPIPSPRFGDIVFSRIRQLHIWLKRYCRIQDIPFVDNFSTFLNRPQVFKRDGLHESQASTSAPSIWTGWNHFKCTPVLHNSFNSFEHLGFRIHSKNPVLILIIYRPPKPNSVFIQEFSEFLSYFMSKFDRVLILGDFNIHVCCPTQGFITDFLDVLDSFNLTQAVNEPTHSKGHTLDLVLFCGLSPNHFKCMDCVSDHKAILFNMVLSFLNADQETAVRRRVFNPLSAFKFSGTF
ncbi:hypothetical protein N1851_024558 [Merluccius polli]|uniref:Uncharacterized protein n=1 Tax=Merluccius polli TaxID=89951 RepID=A0AA47MES7_MERPO|nr:hypothetical protein N1851_024558 [Merluccius polli]